MQHTPPEPGQPVVINPVTVAAEGIVAAAITIPAMWVFAGAFVPVESARRLKKLFRFLAMLPFMIVLWLVRLVRRRAPRWMCGRFSLASERAHEAAPSADSPARLHQRPATRGYRGRGGGMSSAGSNRSLSGSNKSLAASVEEARERASEDSLNGLRALSLTRVVLARPIECAIPHVPMINP